MAVTDPNPLLSVGDLCFSIKGADDDHIQELKAEYAAVLDHAERREIAAEIAMAEAKLAEEEAAVEALMDSEPPL